MMAEDVLILPGKYANYFGQRWKVSAVGVTGGERYYWLAKGGTVLMAPAFMVGAWKGK